MDLKAKLLKYLIETRLSFHDLAYRAIEQSHRATEIDTERVFRHGNFVCVYIVRRGVFTSGNNNLSFFMVVRDP